MVNPTFTKDIRSRWLDFGHVLVLRFYKCFTYLDLVPGLKRKKKNLLFDQYPGLSYDLLDERASWNGPCVLIGYPSEKDGPVLPARGFPRWSRKKDKETSANILTESILSSRLVDNAYLVVDISYQKEVYLGV